MGGSSPNFILEFQGSNLFLASTGILAPMAFKLSQSFYHVARLARNIGFKQKLLQKIIFGVLKRILCKNHVY